MFHTKSDYLNRLLVVLDLAVGALTYLLVLEAYSYFRSGFSIDYVGHLGVGLVMLAAFLVGRRIFYPDRFSLRTSATSLLFRTMQEIVFSLTVTFAVIFLLKLDFVSRTVVLSFAGSQFLLLVVIRRFLAWWYFRSGRAGVDTSVNVLIIGSGRRARYLADRLSDWSGWGVNVVGFLDPLGESAGRRKGDVILGHSNEISSVLRENVIEDVVVAVPRSLLGGVQNIIDACQEEGVRLCFMADVYDIHAARVRMALLGGIPLITFEPVARGESKLIVKRMTDLILVLLATPFLLPLCVVVAAMIKLDSKGPVLFTQNRVGLFKRKFKMYKFRSMVEDAEAKIAEIEHLNEAEGPNFKIGNDPRVTRVGRWIRKTSIDELPQLLNVVLGDMSLVGPRPMSQRDVDLFDKGIQRKRFSVRPGITGLWQVSGRSNLSFEKWLELDLDYIDNWSLMLDLKILFKTVPAVVRGSGAV